MTPKQFFLGTNSCLRNGNDKVIANTLTQRIFHDLYVHSNVQFVWYYGNSNVSSKPRKI